MSGFSDEERERVRAALLDAGRRLFSRYGLSKTTVADLTDAVGIATGTFYTFFDSKERLYLDVLEAESAAVVERVTAALDAEDDPEAAVRAFLRELFTVVEENDLFRQALQGDDRDRLLDAVTDAEVERNRSRKLGLLAPYVEEWQRAGEVRDGDPETLAFAVESVAVLAGHAHEFADEAEYERVRDTLVDLVAGGLVARED